MSVCDDICSRCLDKRYIICTLCGAPIEHWNAGLRGLTRGHVSGDLWVSDSRPCCYSCYDNAAPLNDRWQPTPMSESIVKYDKVGSTRKFGVEIETSYCPGCSNLKGHTLFGVKSDPTISGLEFDSPVLYGDEGFEIIRKLLAYADRHHWEVDYDCGCHTHFDMRGESEDQLWAVYYAYNITYPMWSAAVDVEWVADIPGTDFRSYSYDADRYDYLNIVAYGDHNTFEVRLLDGTLNIDTVCNWLALHARFIDRVHNMSFAEIRELGSTRSKQFRSLVELIDDAPLTDWLAHRARYTGERPLRGPSCAS